jgi:hypothetical protein
MKRSEIEHVIRAAGSIANVAEVVIGAGTWHET